MKITDILADWESAGCLVALSQMRRGLEKESLRVNEASYIAQTPHPPALGSALCHPHITTDYSEALVEFITPPFADYQSPIEFLAQLHQWAYSQLPDEILWAASMPCRLPEADQIPIAQYGQSNLGQLKHLYRQGLAHRYGSVMQTIAGVHYNLSFPQVFWERLQVLKGDTQPLQVFIDQQYFHLIRNFQRHHWWLLLLMGASPAVCRSFVEGQGCRLNTWDQDTVYLPNATSLRMSDLGYQNARQGPLYISHDNLMDYIATLNDAIRTPHADYLAISERFPGRLVQLNPNVLQIENEYYGPVRPKRALKGEERPITALLNRGIEYIEVRCLDLNPFEPVGISADQLKCLDVFLLYCLLMPSETLSQLDEADNQSRVAQVVLAGRDPNKTMVFAEKTDTCLGHARRMMSEMQVLAARLDQVEGLQANYSAAVESYHAALVEPDQLVSARLLASMQENQQSFVEYAFVQSQQHRNYLEQLPTSDQATQQWASDAEQSWQVQTELEQGDLLGFDAYLRAYIEL